MSESGKKEMQVFFSQSHGELFTLTEKSEYPISAFLDLLKNLAYTVHAIDDQITAEQLTRCQILVLGIPTEDLTPEESQAVQQFVEAGGGCLLLLSNTEMIMELLPNLHTLTAQMGLEIQEYHNYQPTFLQQFYPHYITADLKRLKVKNVASVKVHQGAYALALTKATREPIIACAEVGDGRVVIIGDGAIFSNDLLKTESNTTLARNTFHWLARHNPIDIQGLELSEEVEFGQVGNVVVHLQHRNNGNRPDVECVLQSDVDAVILEPIRKKYALPSEKSSRIHWSSVAPQILGDQQLRLVIRVGDQSLHFDELFPGMSCMAPGYLDLKIRAHRQDHNIGELQTTFQTGTEFIVEGKFQWTGTVAPIPYTLALELGEGLIERKYDPKKSLWHVKAVAPGTHDLTLKIVETGQEVPALVTVKSSEDDQLAELYVAYVYPLEAEIVERLRQVDNRLVDERIRKQPFEILSPQEFVRKVYKSETASRFQTLLVAAYREQWYNYNLIDTLLSHLAPTYLPDDFDGGSFIPFDPGLASKLSKLHPSSRKYLEYNLLCTEESEDITIKQNIAAYLLHEKYGHGFFYKQTRLGQQLAILLHHGFPGEPDEDQFKPYRRAASLIKDSAIIINEGFAAWMELTFLGKLDRDVRQAVYPRYMHLIQNATGLYQDRLGSEFFEVFPPRCDSRYREGFEYLDYIAQNFHLRCVFRLFLLATQVELGVIENAQGRIEFTLEADEIVRRLNRPEESHWCSHLRLRQIADVLYQDEHKAKSLVRNRACTVECQQSDCPLSAFIAEQLTWRMV